MSFPQMFLKRKLKSRNQYLVIVVLVIIFTSYINFSTVFEYELPPTAFSDFKSNLENESVQNQVPGNCSEKYGTELIQNWRRGHLNVCSGFGKSKISCHVNNENRVNRTLCMAENAIIDVNNFKATEAGKTKTLIVDCDPAVHGWIPNYVLSLPMHNISRVSALECRSYVNHTVFWFNRYDFRNPYHILEDIVTTLESFLILDIDPVNVELIIWDDFPTTSVFHQVWSLIFGKGVRLLREKPFPDQTCFRNSIFSMEGGKSLISGMGGAGKDTGCTSPMLKTLRKFFYQSVAIPERTLGKQVYRIGFISRKQYDPTRTIGRVISNEDELLKFIKDKLPPNWELVILRPELLKTFKENVEIFEGLDILVGTHGAGLANVIFMRPGTGLVEVFFDDRDPNNRHYYNMCKWLGVRYYTPGYFHNFIDQVKLWGVLSQAISEIAEVSK